MATCSRRIIVAPVLLAAVLLAFAAAARAQSPGGTVAYPHRSVKVLVGFAAGGLPDTVGRLINEELSARWGQRVITENRPGAGGLLAAEALSKAPADGYTLFISDSSVTSIKPYLYPNLAYSETDFAQLGMVARAPLFLAVNASIGAHSMTELIALARANPGRLNYASSGVGSLHHLGMEALKSALGLDIVHVAYRGSGESVPALISGRVAMAYSAGPSLAGYARDGRLRILAVNSATRSALAPDVPTVAESGVPAYDFAPSIGYLAPAGTPREVILKIARDLAEVVKSPNIARRFADLGIEAVGSTPEQHAAQWRSDAERYSRVMRKIGARPE
jgi:tripartite-type tricarboxylate transporter receptor subunit TctC